MNKEKQIEEMANIMRDNEDVCKATQCPNCKYENCDYTICIHMLSAEALYTAGYRKASDVAREIFAAADETINTICVMTGIEITVVGGKYLGLKKKYTEEDDE